MELPLFCLLNGRPGMALKTWFGMALFWASVFLVWPINPVGAKWVLVGPFFLSSLLIMFGNW